MAGSAAGAVTGSGTLLRRPLSRASASVVSGCGVSADELSSTAACDPGRENPPSKKGKKKGNPSPRVRNPSVVDPHTAAWCTASNPNPGAELQPGLRLISSSSMRLRVVTCGRVLRTAAGLVLGHKILSHVCPNASPSNSMKVLSLHPIPYSLSPLPYSPPLCYNHRAVERAARWGLAQVQADPAQAAVQSAVPLQVSPIPVARTEHPSRYCPACSQRLESRRCKLICSVCGYYMSCADYY